MPATSPRSTPSTFEKNYNARDVVAEESGKDAGKATVTLYHDAAHPSALYLPIAQPPAWMAAH